MGGAIVMLKVEVSTFGTVEFGPHNKLVTYRFLNMLTA
jgi:hypothetical protein